MNKPVTVIDILRHGQTEGGEIFRGKTDVMLSEEGLRQMDCALIGHAGWEHIITSPMQRCLYFSARLALKHNISHTINDDFQEISFGDWDGKTFVDVKHNNSKAFENFWRDPIKHTPPGAEPIGIFHERVKTGFWQEIERHQGKHLLMVVHGGVVRAILSEVLKTPMDSLLRFYVPYACLTRIKIYHEGKNCWPQLVFHNVNVKEGEIIP